MARSCRVLCSPKHALSPRLPRLQRIWHRDSICGRIVRDRATVAAADSRHSDGEPVRREEDGGDGEDPFFSPLFAGLLQAGFFLTIATGVSSSQNIAWNFDIPSDAALTVLACSLLPTLFPVAVCLPWFATGPASTDVDFLGRMYDKSGSLLLNIGSDEDEESRGVKGPLALKQQVTGATLTTALSLIQTFWLTPWKKPQAVPVLAGTILGRTAALLAIECLFRGTLLLCLRDGIRTEVVQADSGSWLFWLKVFGLANEQDAMTAAVVILVVLLMPVVLIQPKAIQEFARAAINKPIRDNAMTAVLTSKSQTERLSNVQSVMQQAGASTSELAALLSGAQMPKQEPRAAVGQPATAAGPSAASAGPNASDLDAFAGRGMGPDASVSGNGTLSKESMEMLLLSEAVTAAAFKSLKQASSTAEAETAAMALIEAANGAGEAALRAMVEAGGSRSGPDAEQVVAAAESLEALKSSRERVRAARLRERQAQQAEQQDVQDDEEFQALVKVETPEDKLVAQLLASYSLACTIGVNLSFLASGSLAVSFGTSWMVRVLPLIVIEAAKWLKQPELASAGGADDGGRD